MASLVACTDRTQDPVDIFATQVAVEGEKPTTIDRLLERGAYLVEVREQEIDLRVVVNAAGTASTLEDRAPRYGAIYKVVSVESPTNLRVEIASVDHKTKRGNAAVRISRWLREPGATPGELEAGFLARSEAGELAIADDQKAWTRAVDKLHEAVAHFDAADDDAARADAAYALAYIQYGPRDQYAAAIRASEMAADAFDDVGDETGVRSARLLRASAEIDLAAAMNGETQRAEQRSLYNEADRVLEESAQWFIEHGQPLRAQSAVNMRAVRAVNLGDYESAARLLDEAVEMAKRSEDVRGQVRVLNNLAALHVFMGLSAQAAEEYEALVPLIDSKTQTYQYAALLANLGVTLIDLGEFDRALIVHNEALGYFDQLGEKSEVAVEYAQLGSLYLRMGNAQLALKYLRDAIPAHELAGDAQPLAGTLRLAAVAAAILEDHTAALEYLQRSVRVDTNPQSVARTKTLISGELRALGRLDAAAAELVEPLKATNELVLASALEERAQLNLAQGKARAAIEDYRAADAHYVALGLEVDRINLQAALAHVLLTVGDLDGARTAADQSIAIVSNMRVKSANPEWRARFLSARYSPFEARIAVHMASGSPDASWQAFRVAEEVRARSLSDELARGSTSQRVIDPEEIALRSQLSSLQLRLESSVDGSESADAGSAALRRSIAETRAKIDAVRARNGVAAAGSSLPESLAQVQGAMPRGIAVLAYFVGDSKTYGWLLTRDKLRQTTLPGRKKLEQLIAGTRQEQRTRSGTKESADLGALLFGDLLKGITEQRILLLADGPLNNVPFAALVTPDEPAKILVERFVVGSAPSLALAMSTPAHERSRNTRVAVISDPIYAPDDGRLLVAMKENGSIERGQPKPSKHGFVRLRFSALEASAVERAFGRESTTRLAGFDAMPNRVLDLPSADLAVLHFATHAITGGDEPEQSALFLSEYSPTGDLQGKSEISALDIAQHRLRADVVVLSACGTGDGNALRGEGVLGLTYEFLANGSHSVVASLWPVEDAATARFMNEFYLAYRENGSAAEALRAAQLKMRAAGKSGVWSSFVVRANEFP